MIKQIKAFLQFRDKVDVLFKSVAASKLDNNFLKTNYPELTNELETWFTKLCPSLPFRTGCASCFSDHFWHLKTMSINEIINKMNLLHKLKDEIVLDWKGQYYSNKSPHLTNEICQELHDRFGAHVFEKFDKEWRSKVVTIDDIDKEITADTLTEFFAEEAKPVIEEESEPVIEETDMSNLTRKELEALAKEKNIKYFGVKTVDLIKLLS